MRHKVFIRGGHYKTSLGPNGGEATGPILLSRDPQVQLEAATKQYADNKVTNIDASAYTSGTLTPERLPAFTGDITKSEGSSIINITSIGVSAGSYTKATVNQKGQVTAGTVLIESDIPNLDWSKITSDKPTTLAGYGITDGLARTNPVMTGTLKVSGTFTTDEQLVNKEYVDQQFSTRNLVGNIDFKLVSTTPAKYLRCNGGEVSKTTYAALYSVVGDQFSYSTHPGSGKPWKQQYAFNTEQSGDITGWTTGTSLPVALNGSQAIVTKNRVYLLGGHNGSSRVNTVYTAPINEDGTLGSWTTGTSLPGVLAYSQAIVTKNRVYLLGGYNGGSAVNTVYTAPINEDGTLGAWVTGTSLPGALGISQAIVTKNRVYLLGGFNGVTVSTVYTAPINEDGTLGTWTTGTSLPGALSWSQAIVTKNRVYLLGGTSSGYTATVYTAPINEDGTLGVWTTGTSLPGAFAYSQAIVTKNRVYLLGGTNSSTVYTAPINSDGTLGSWTTGTPLPGVLGISQAIVTKNRVYLMGGIDGSDNVSTVYTALFSGGLNDYSSYHDGSVTAVTDPNNFRLPDITSPYQNSYAYIRYEQ